MTCSGPAEYSTDTFFWWPTIEKFEKSIFQICLKFDLKGLGYRFLVQNASKTLQEPISGHISHVRTYPANLWKIEILAQIMISHIFGIAHYGLLYGQKWLEMWFIAVNGLSGPSKYSYILWMTYYDVYIWNLVTLKNRDFCIFSLLNNSKEKMQKSRFFKMPKFQMHTS